MKIKDLHFSCKPDFKLIKQGASNLDNGELLSILLWKSDQNEGILELSNKIIQRYNLNNLEEIGFENLKREVGRIEALKLLSFIELSKRYNKLVNKGYKNYITCAKDVYDMFVDQLKDKKKEHLYVLLLDSKNTIIKEDLVSVGTLNSSLFHPREVFHEAIKNSANSIILVHNHPSGDFEPSEEDIEITNNIKDAGKILGIKVIDHIIIANDSWKSV